MGYTLVTLSVGLWAYWHSTSFVDGLLKVVNAGGDADTNELFPPPLHAPLAHGGEGGSWGMSYTQGSGPVLGYAALSGLGCVCSFTYINDAIYNGR